MIDDMILKPIKIGTPLLFPILFPVVFLASCYSLDSFEEFPAKDFLKVSEINGNTTEYGGEATFSVVLLVQPSGDVIINLTSNDKTEGTVTSPLVFTTANWNEAQPATVTGVDDDIFDGYQEYSVSISAESTEDSLFSDVTADDIWIKNKDDETKLTALQNYNFTLLQTSGSCPIGFSSGTLTLDTDDESNTDDLSGSYGDTQEIPPGIVLKLCSTQTAGIGNVTAMKGSAFIVLRTGGYCPSGYNRGEIRIDTEDDYNSTEESGNVGDSYFTDNDAFLYLCESNDDPNLENLKADNFTILKNGDCPLGSEEGYLGIDTEDNVNSDGKSGDTGDSDLSTAYTNSVYLRMCTFTR